MSTTVEREGAAGQPTLTRLAGRVDAAMAALSGLDHDARAVAKEVKASLEAFHGEALRRVVRRLKDDDRGRELLMELVDDDLVRATLGLHGILRPPVHVQAERALAGVRPYLESHGGGVSLVEITDDGVARVRREGACNGCSMSAQTLTNAVQVALVEGVPEIGGIEVVTEQAVNLISPESLTRRPQPSGPATSDGPGAPVREAGSEAGWVRGPGLLEIGDPGATIARTDLGEILVVQDGGVVAAYRNQCGHLGLSLEDADVGAGKVICAHHGYRFDVATGAGLTEPGSALSPIPSRVEGVHVWLRPGS